MAKAKEPTRAQLSSRLAYNAQTPAFLQKLQRKIAGQDDDDDDPEYEDYDDGSGRPPIPRRPAIPTRPDDDPGSADEEEEEEGPQIVVLKEGKHLSSRDVENEKRKAKGLSPLPEADNDNISPLQAGRESTGISADSSSSSKQTQSLSFSSLGSKSAGKKRKAVGDVKDNDQEYGKKKRNITKKPKKTQTKLLSFHEDA